VGVVGVVAYYATTLERTTRPETGWALQKHELYPGGQRLQLPARIYVYQTGAPSLSWANKRSLRSAPQR
jgi:hypothetical protein